MRHELPPLTPNPVIDAYKADVDVTLIRENLKLSPNERSRQLEQIQELHEELRAAGAAAFASD